MNISHTMILFVLKSLKVLHINTRSLRKHYNELEALILSQQQSPEILAVTETWLNPNDEPNCFALPNYKVFNKARDTRGGGVMIQCLKCVSVIDELDSPFEECLFLKVKYHGNIFLIAVVYNPPRINKLLFIYKLDQFLESLSKGLPVLIMGDIKIDVLKQNDATLRYLATIEANGCNFLNNKITRPASNGGTCLDHAICKNFDLAMISLWIIVIISLCFSKRISDQRTILPVNILLSETPVI